MSDRPFTGASIGSSCSYLISVYLFRHRIAPVFPGCQTKFSILALNGIGTTGIAPASPYLIKGHLLFMLRSVNAGLFPAVSHSLNALLVHYVAKSNIRTRVRLGRSLAVSASLPMPFDTSHALCG